jgi:hypothetical protein
MRLQEAPPRDHGKTESGRIVQEMTQPPDVPSQAGASRPYLPPPADRAVNGELFGGPFDGCIVDNYLIRRAISFNVVINQHVMVPYPDETVVDAVTPSLIKVYDIRKRTASYAHDGTKWRYVKGSADGRQPGQ